jgi:parallel beta-helix repeat protein
MAQLKSGTTIGGRNIVQELDAHKSDTASTTAKGHIQLATVEEAVAGTDTTKAVTPAGVKAALPISLPANGGNADTADKLATARTITLSGDVSGSASFDGSSNITINATVADDSHNHVISNIDNLQSTLDAKASVSHTHTSSKITDFNEATQDAIGAILTDTSTIDFTYDDTNNQIKADVKPNSSNQKVAVSKNSTTPTGTRKQINFKDGTNISVTVADNATNDAVDVTITNTYTHPTGDGNLHVPATGTTNNNKVLKAGSTAGSLSWSNVNWSELTNKPSSSVSSIDNAVTNSHTHSNKALLDTYTQTEANLADAVSKKHAQNTDNTLTSSGSNTINTSGTGNIVDFKVSNTTKASVDNTGKFTGKSASADKLATARTITLTGDVTGSASFDGSTNISISATVADDSHNHVISNIDNLQTTLNSKAPLASPAFTGTPTAPTASNGTNTNQIATTKFVQNALSAGGYGDMSKAIYDTDNDGVVDNASALQGHDASYFETPSGAQAKVDALAGEGRTTETVKGNADALDEHKAKTASHVKPARIVIGTTAAGWTAKDCHYLCDGIDDQAEINAAIQALPANGGEIVILDGTYNITAKIDVNKSNVSIKGNGNATILKRMWESSSKEGVITLTSVEGCRVQNLQIDGNKANYSSVPNYGIYLNSSSNNTITGIICNNNSYGIYLNSSSNNTVTGNTCNNNNYYGIYLNSSSNNTVTGNTCNNNNSGIYLISYSSDNTVTGNTCNNNNSYGIRIELSSNNTVTGNTCNNNNYYGIYLGASSNNTVTGNTCIRGTGQTSDYTSSQYTILLANSFNDYNLISSNNCMGKAVVVEGGTGNSIWGNKYDATNDLP